MTAYVMSDIYIVYAYAINDNYSLVIWSIQDITLSQQGWPCLEGPVVQYRCLSHYTAYRT